MTSVMAAVTTTTAAAAAAGPGTDHRSAAGAALKHRGRTTIPTQSGKWILGKTIGAGSMGKVKLARKEDGVEQVACKIIPRASADDHHHQHASRADKERADHSKEIRTAREAAIVTLLNHPHICGLRDVIRTNHHWYMLFEFVNGGQMLDYIISHGRLREKQARKFSRQIASALDYCHRNSIVHRDLKIENILISKTGDIKIIDFGLSNLFAPRGYLKTFCGSLYFAAPELLQARAYTGPEVDVWSFGVVLYVLVCGRVPFDDQSMPALHAKIKRGLVDYPNWLSAECKHLLSRMLVTDPKQRATMHDVMNHPWMLKGYGVPPESFLPVREPLTLPLDREVINSMTGFNFGPPEMIRIQLAKIIESEEYCRAVRLYQKEREMPQPPRDVEKRRMLGFDFYKRRNSSTSRDNLTMPSTEGLPLGSDPLNAFSPLISVYYLVREKQERDRIDVTPPSPHPVVARNENAGAVTTRPGTAAAPASQEPTPPKEAHTNASAFEMPDESPTGGRSRPRARTNGEDEITDTLPIMPLAAPQSPDLRPDASQKKESGATGLLRRFSTRKRPDKGSHPPLVHIHSPTEGPAPPRKSFSIRRSWRDRDEGSLRVRSGSTQPQATDQLLSPPLPSAAPRSKGLGRSTSVNSADMRRRMAGLSIKEPPLTSGSDRSAATTNTTTPTPDADIGSGGVADRPPNQQQQRHQPSRSISLRAKTLGHARRESIQLRRLRLEEAREANLPEEADRDHGEGRKDHDGDHDLDGDQGNQSGVSTDRLGDDELAKPVFLKGLFSVSTTSPKSVPEIRAEIRRVLKQLDVDYTEIKGGFSCRHAPSIDLDTVVDPPMSPAQTPGHHRRRFSFGGLRGAASADRDGGDADQRYPATPRNTRPSGFGHRAAANYDSNSSMESVRGGATTGEDCGHDRGAVGETSTHVQSDLGGSMVVEFEIFIVKVPLFSLHGIQFKRMVGNTWQFKSMADQILKALRL